MAARVEELLREHPTLILRFNNFLPKEHEIKLKHEPRQELVRLVDNIKVKNEHVLIYLISVVILIGLLLSIGTIQKRSGCLRIILGEYEILQRR